MKKVDFSNETLLVEETLYSTSNGYIGLRGNFEEGYELDYKTIRGTYINGFYDDVPIEYGESAFGFPTTAQKMLNVFDGQDMTIEIDGELFSMFTGKIFSYERGLDIRGGYAYRKINWASNKGHRLELEFKRMATFNQQELAVIWLEITSVNYTGDIKIRSSIKTDVSNYIDPDDPRVATGHSKLLKVTHMINEEDVAGAIGVTIQSGLNMSLFMSHNKDMVYTKVHNKIQAEVCFDIKIGESQSLVKYLAYADSLRHTELIEASKMILKKAKAQKVEDLFGEQKVYLDKFWKYALVEIENDKDTAYAINYSIYQLLASAGQKIGSQISAKGLSGEGYEGHYFWDTEIYMLPLFTLSNENIAKNILSYRYDTLDKARDRSHIMGHHKGAKIPWRTISGSECSAFFPAGSAQYHINADVAYAIIQYYLATDDMVFIKEKGFEVIFETARLWLEVGNFDERGLFNINAVTGPDEYTAIVNNNYYTNAMAKYHLEWAVKLFDLIKAMDYTRYLQLEVQMHISEEELDLMSSAGDKMCLLYDKTLGINVQDEGFLQKASWDFEHTPKEKYPLLLHFHPLTIYRAKVLKQADTVLAHFLLDNVEDSVLSNSYHYYEKFTTHDSSLSPCVYSMMASRIDETTKAYDYYMKTLKLDLDNLHHNTKDGLHIANAGGAYMGIIYGFGGLRIKEDGLHFRPRLPKAWKTLTFRLKYKGACIIFKLGQKITVETSLPVKIFIDEVLYEIVDQLEVKYYGKH